jgi:glutamate carboxypeptidase
MDTLCPPDSPFLHLTEEGKRLRGPGVADMKGGLVVLIWAVKVLERCGLLGDFPLVCLFNADEEVGSPTSWTLFTAMKGRASHALVFEMGGTGGAVVTTRKGVARYRLDLTGKAAHFGCLKGRKVSAVHELAYKTLAIESLNEPDGSLAANVGKVSGGLAANAVAESAAMEFEVRYWTREVEERARKRIEDLTAQPTVPGCRLELSRLSHRPPLQPSAGSLALFRRIGDVARGLAQAVAEEKRGGVSDANWLSHAGIPTMDGLGPLGDLDFTDEEFIVKETLFQRIELVAHLLLNLKEERP